MRKAQSNSTVVEMRDCRILFHDPLYPLNKKFTSLLRGNHSLLRSWLLMDLEIKKKTAGKQLPT